MKQMKRAGVFILVLVVCLIFSCPFNGAASQVEVQVVTSIPIETKLSHFGTADAAEFWVDMIARATNTIDMAHFYLSTNENEPLEPIITELLKAADRGVKIRVLVGRAVNKSMAERTEAVMKRLKGKSNIQLTTFDWRKLTGGILHAKYFIIDNREIFVGSQNFDWRSLKHIHETGLHIKGVNQAMALRALFEADWQFNNGDKEAYKKMLTWKPVTAMAGTFVVASPQKFNPPGIKNALDILVGLIDGAKKKITVQLLNYHVDIYKSSEKFIVIDESLRRAAKRGVKVQLLVSDWNKGKPGVNGLKELVKVPNIEVKFATIPSYSKAFIPYARVIHSKVMCIDGIISWVGNSNWGDRYFYQSRNIEVVTHVPEVAVKLGHLFTELWNSEYTYVVDPAKEYAVPRRY
jgi:phosphatidylserine/phosphatidylglycerophosphate/cardiolipin synthase-like enzyme